MGRHSRFLGSWGELRDSCSCDILDKRASVYNYMMLMYDRTNQIFKYSGLPDTIPAYMLELYLQINGHVCITEVNGKLYALPGGMGGAVDPYYRPTLYVIANPGLGYSASLSILNHLPPFAEQDTQGKCVVIRNDINLRGLFYMFSRFATQLTENDISIRCAQINSRQHTFISGNTDSQIASANEYLENIEKGKIIAVGDQAFLDGIKPVNVSAQGANTIMQLIELQQYLKASWFNEMGLDANFNMKREYLSEEEINLSSNAFLPLIDNMLQCRREALEFVNREYGTNITVTKNSAWEEADDPDQDQEDDQEVFDASEDKQEEGGPDV